MITVVGANERYFADEGWLKTYRLFAFGEYQDQKNVQWGALRVFNDDTVESGGGFPNHPHQDIEIITIVLSGEITHQERGRAHTIIPAGKAHVLSAGAGVIYSDFNYGRSAAHFYKIWIFPSKNGITPHCDQKKIDSAANALTVIVSGGTENGVLRIMADATVSMGHLDVGRKIVVTPDPRRRQFLYLGEGALIVNNHQVGVGDQVRIFGEERIIIRGNAPTRFIYIDIPDAI